jgi:hypothetical protein
VVFVMRGFRGVLLSVLLVLVLGLWPGVGQVRLIGLFVVPTDYPTIRAALQAAEDAGGGTVVVLEGDYSDDIFINFYEKRNKRLRILGVGAILNGNVSIGCGAQDGLVEISGFQIFGDITACAQSLADLIMAITGGGPDPSKLGGQLILQGNSIQGDVRLEGLFGFNYTLEMSDNMITGGVRVEIELGGSTNVKLKNNWIFGSAGEGVHLLRLGQGSVKLEGNVIEAHSSHGLVLEVTDKQPTPPELIGNIIQQNGGCGIWVNTETLRPGAQLQGQANSVYLNGEGDFCPDPSSSEAARQLFPPQLSSTKVWRVCPQPGPNCDTTKIQEALDKSQQGDVIIILPGVYAENLRVRSSRILKRGRPTAATASLDQAQQADRVVLQGQEGPGIVIEGGVVFIEGFTIQGFKERCVERQGDRCIEAESGDGIRQQGRSQVFLRDVRLLQNDGWGMQARSSLLLEGVLISQNRAGGLALADGALASVLDVQIIENKADGMALFGPRVRLQDAFRFFIGGNQGCGLAAYPFEPGIDPLAAGRGLGRTPLIEGEIKLVANGADLCGALPKEVRQPLAAPRQSSAELSCPGALQETIDSLQPGGRLQLRGTCPRGAVLDKPLLIEGSGADSTVIPMLSLLAGADVQLNNLSVGRLQLAPGAKLTARQAKLAGVWVEGGELTAEGSQLQGPVRLWGLSVPVRLSLKSSSVQGALELWALRQEIEAELTETQLTGTGAEVGIRAFGLGGLGHSQLLVQRSRISSYKTGLLAAGRSFTRLENTTITGNELGVALASPLCLAVGGLWPGAEVEGLNNQISGNKQDFCPEGLKPLLTRSESGSAYFAIEELAVQPPPPLTAGTTATITATVRNRGDRADSKTVWLEVQGKRQGEQSLTLRPGAKARVSFSFSFPEAGSFTLTVRSPDSTATTTVEVQRVPAQLSVCCNLAFQAARGGPPPSPQRFTISNRGGQPLNWSASADKGWVKISPDRGTLQPGEQATVTVTVDLSGLPEGNHSAQITVTSPEAANSPQLLVVGVQVKPATLGNWRIVLTWGAKPTDLDSHLWTPDGEHIWYGNPKGRRADLDKDVTDGQGPETVTIRLLVNGTYVYAVKRFSNDGTLRESGVRVEVLNAATSVRSFTNPPCALQDEWWVVFKLRVRESSVDVETVNKCLRSFNQASSVPPNP